MSIRKYYLLVLLLAPILISISINDVFAEGVSLDRRAYPIPTEGSPLTIYVTAPGEVTISVGWGSNIQVLGTTNSGVFTIQHDDFDFRVGGALIAEYWDELTLKKYHDGAAFDDRTSTLQIPQPLYVAGDVVILTLIDPDRDYDSRAVESYTASEVDISLTYDVGVISLSDPIFATTMFKETGNRTGIFTATMTIPEKIGQYEIHHEETILKHTGGYELPLTITDVIGSFEKEILIDIGDTVTWYGSNEYTVVAGDPDVDDEKLGVLYPHGFNSGIIEEGVFAHKFDVSGMFSHKFDVLGKYPYYNKLNPQMKGTIIVGGLYGIPNDSITSDSQDSPIINCSVGTYLVDGVCKPRPDLIETTSVSITSAEPKILNTNNERVSIAHVGETLFVGVEIENLGDNTEDFVASYRYLASSVGDWSDWTWVSASINSGKYSDVAIPWNPTLVDNYEFDIQIWDNIQEKNIITNEKLIISVKSAQTTPELTSNEPIKEKIPGWIKNNAGWWSKGQIDDDTFVNGIQFLMKEKIVNIPDLPEQASEKARPSFVDESKDPQSYVDRYNNEESYKEWFDENYPDYTIQEAVGITTPIPGWIKNNADWWAQGLITDDDFIKGIEFLVEKRILNVEPVSHSKPQSESEQPTQQEQTFSFDESKKSILSDLVQIKQSHKFDIVFDKDLTSRQKEGAILHTYKIIHETDGWIGDLTFYSGKPPLFPSSDFDKIFRVKFFISNEYGVKPTSAALPIIKSSLEELVPEWNMINKDQTSSDWIDAVIQYSQSDSSGEKKETIRSDQQEIKFAYNEKGGFAELIITQKIS